MRHQKLIYILITVLILIGLYVPGRADSILPQKNILELSVFNEDLDDSHLRDAKEHSHIKREYRPNLLHLRLDLERTRDRSNWQTVYHFLSKKITSGYFDVIIVHDDASADFLLAQKDLPENLPIVIAGYVKDPSKLRERHKNLTVITRSLPIFPNIMIGTRLLGKGSRAVIIADDTEGNQQQVKVLKSRLALHSDAELKLIDGKKLKDSQDLFRILKKHREENPKTFAVFLPWHGLTGDLYSDRASFFFDFQREVDIPFLVMTDPMIGRGALGGMASSSTWYADQLFDILNRVFRNGNRADLVEFRQGQVFPVFDYQILKAYKLSPSELPPNTKLLNEPASKIYLLYLIGALVLILVLIVFLIFFGTLTHSKLGKLLRRSDEILNVIPARLYAVNRAGYVIWNCSKGEWNNEKHPITQYISIDNNCLDDITREKGMRLVEKAFESGESERELFHFDGDVRHVQMHRIPKEFFGEDAVLCISMDASELEKLRKEAENQSEFYRTTLHSIGDAVIATDAQGKITLINQIAEELTGYTKEEAIGQELQGVFHLADSRTQILLQYTIRSLLEETDDASDSYDHSHTTLVSSKGNRYHISHKASHIIDSKGEITGIVLVFRDITKEYKMREDMVKRNELLRTTAEVANLRFFTYDIKHNLQSRLEEDDADHFWPFKNGNALSAKEVVLGEDLQDYLSVWEQLLSGEKKRISHCFRSDYSGRRRYFNITASRFQEKSGSHIIQGIIQDVTEQKKLEMKELEHSKQIQFMFSALDAGIYAKDYDQNNCFVLLNERYCQVLGKTEKELLGQPEKDFIEPGFHEEILRQDQNVLDGRGQQQVFHSVTMMHGKKLYYQTRKSYYRRESDGHRIIVGVLFDVSQLRKVEMEALESKRLLQAIIDNIPASLAVKDPDDQFRYILWNKTSVQNWGISAAEVVGKTAKEVEKRTENCEDYHASDLYSLQHGEYHCESLPFTNYLGKQMVFERHKKLVDLGEGKRAILVLSTDITKLKHLESEQRNALLKLDKHLHYETLARKCLDHIMRISNFDDSLLRVLHEVGTEFHSSRAYLIRYQAGSDQMGTAVIEPHEWLSEGTSSALPQIQKCFIGHDEIWHKYIYEKGYCLVNDCDDLPPDLMPLSPYLKEIQVRSFAVCGIWEREKLYGFIAIDYTTKPHTFTSDEIEVINNISNIVSIVIERRKQQISLDNHLIELQQLNTSLKEFIRRDAVKRECLELLFSSSDKAITLDALTELTGKYFNATCCALFQHTGKKRALISQWSHESNTMGLDVSRQELSYAMMENTPQDEVFLVYRGDTVFEPALQEKLDGYMERGDIHVICAKPVIVNGIRWGLLGFSRTECTVLKPSEISLLSDLVNICEIYLTRELIRDAMNSESMMKQTIFESSPIPLILFNSNQRIIMINKEAQKIIGKSKGEILSENSCYKIFCKRDSVPDECPFQHTLKTRKPCFARLSIYGRQYDVSTQPIFQNGRLTSVLQAMVDQTELLESEQHHRETSELFTTVLETVPCLISVKDYYNESRYLIANNHFHSLSGFEPNFIIGKNDQELFGGTMAARYHEYDSRAMERKRLEYDEILLSTDGKKYYLHTYKLRIPRTNTQDLLLAVSFDVTEINNSKREIEENRNELLQVNKKLHTYLDQALILRHCTEELVAHMDHHQALDMLVEGVGKALKSKCCHIVKYEKDMRMNVTASWNAKEGSPGSCDNAIPVVPEVLSFVKWMSGKGEITAIRGQASGDPELDHEMDLYLEKNGTNVLFCCLIRCNGQPWGHVGFHRSDEVPPTETETHMIREAAQLAELVLIRDTLFDELKEKEVALADALQASQAAVRAKSMFLATMSHEIRTPLNAVIGFSELLKASDLTQKETSEYLNGINHAGNALLKLINDILDLSKLEADQMDVTAAFCDLPMLLQEMSAIFMQKAKDKGIEFAVQAPDSMPRVQINEQAVRQVLLNLIGNAIKFTHSGTVRVSASVDASDGSSGNLRIQVQDTGIGIPKEDQESIFDPFVQQDATRITRGTRAYEGTGLGLSIAKRLIEKMGGTIELSSETGKGSTFTIDFEHIILDSSSPSCAIKSQKTGYKRQELPPLKILLVDDIRLNLRVLAGYMRGLNTECAFATSGTEALEYLSGHKVDLVMTDIWMQGMNGVELAQKIHQMDAYRTLPICAITADVEAKDNFDIAEFSGILNKPISRQEIQNTLLRLFGQGKDKPA